MHYQSFAFLWGSSFVNNKRMLLQRLTQKRKEWIRNVELIRYKMLPLQPDDWADCLACQQPTIMKSDRIFGAFFSLSFTFFFQIVILLSSFPLSLSSYISFCFVWLFFSCCNRVDFFVRRLVRARARSDHTWFAYQMDPVLQHLSNAIYIQAYCLSHTLLININIGIRHIYYCNSTVGSIFKIKFWESAPQTIIFGTVN